MLYNEGDPLRLKQRGCVMKIRTIRKVMLGVALITALAMPPLLPAAANSRLPVSPNAGTQPVVWVDDDYNAGSDGGHSWGVNAFATIQEGLDAASEGGTVYVGPGNYREEVKIYYTVHLVGDPGDSAPGPGANAPTIGGCPDGVPYCSGVKFMAPANGTIIEGFIVRDHPRSGGNTPLGGFGIFSKNEFSAPVADITINDNLFIDNRWESIMFFSTGGNPAEYFTNVAALNNRVENTAAVTSWVGIECTNCRNSLIAGNVIEGRVEKGIWIACESTGENFGFINGMGVVVTGNTVNGAITAAVEVESFDTNAGPTAPILTGVTVTANTFNRTSSTGTQGKYLIYIHRDGVGGPGNGIIHNITISNNQMDHSYAAFAAIYATVADQLTISGNTLTTTATLWEQDQGAAILLYNNDLSNLIRGNHIHIANFGSIPTDGIALAYTAAVPGAAGSFTISENTITSDTAFGAAGIHLRLYFTGSPGESVSISNNRIAGFGNSLKFENTSDAHTFTIRGNAFANNPGGVSSILAAPLTLENNWWGCNAGPNQTGCDPTSGLLDADPWLVLSLQPALSQIAPSASQAFTASLLTNSNGADVTALGINFPSTLAAFSASLGVFSPASSLLANAAAAASYSAPAIPGVEQVCTAVDNQQICQGMFVAGHLVFLPTVLR